MRNKQGIRVFEEYASASAKRFAQKGAVRGQLTGKAISFLFVLPSEGDGKIWAKGAVQHPGSPSLMADTGVGHWYLRRRCRRVGKKYLPAEWKDYLAQLES